MLNKYVFSLRLKLARVVADVTDSGRIGPCKIYHLLTYFDMRHFVGAHKISERVVISQ